MPETWWEYVIRIAGTSAQKEIAAAAGVDPSQVSRWSNGHNPDAKRVVHFARTYKRPPVEALIAAQYLNEDEAAGIAHLTISVRDMAPDALASEIGNLVTELRRRIPGDQGEDWGDGWVGPKRPDPPPIFQQDPAVRRRQS
jgi:transcriptional regulator with XRE-family HTH domain